MKDLIILCILLLLVGASVYYIIKEKKRGKCIGCPYADACAKKNGHMPKKNRT